MSRTPTTLVETSVEGEVFTHRVLWSTCQRHMQVARSEEKGSWYFYLTAMLMGFMTFEAYVNFLGTKLEPELWKEERTAFNTRPYKGTNGKLLKLCELHEVPFPDKGRRPFQTVCRLNELRDIVAHGKPDEFEFTVRHPPEMNPATIKYSLDDYVSAMKAEQAVADLKLLIESLHAQFVARTGADLLLPLAMDGVLASSIGHMGEA
jgi:hypothetical protein